MVAPDPVARLDELAHRLETIPGARLEDLYLERTVDVLWHLRGGSLEGREGLLREGAAVRRETSLRSADGFDRITLADLMGIPPAVVPPVAPPSAPPPPGLDNLRPGLPPGTHTVRWRWRWAAVVRPGCARVLCRPQLIEITDATGRRLLRTWPPAQPAAGGDVALPPGAPPAPMPTGRQVVLLNPSAAAVLLHEVFGHPCEGDILASGRSLWNGRLGQRVLELPLTVMDDPQDGHLPGAFDVDDEGEPAVRRTLVQEGVLTGVLADRRLAARFGTVPGSARRAHIHAPPRPRMSNLVAAPGTGGEAPPRQEARVEATNVAGGTSDPGSGRVFLAVSASHTLRRGHPTRSLPPFTLALTTSALSAGLLAAGTGAPEVASHGWCGKDGEVLATGARTPWLLVAGVEVR